MIKVIKYILGIGDTEARGELLLRHNILDVVALMDAFDKGELD